MKTQVYDRFGGGLFVLVMLTIAVVAGQAEPKFDEPGPIDVALELDAGIQIMIDQERLADLDALSSVVETVPDLPIKVEIGIDNAEPVPDSSDSDESPVQ